MEGTHQACVCRHASREDRKKARKAIINVGQITKYYFGNLVKGMVPEGAEIRKNRFGGKIAKLKEKTKFGGKFLKLTLKQWRERTKLP